MLIAIRRGWAQTLTFQTFQMQTLDHKVRWAEFPVSTSTNTDSCSDLEGWDGIGKSVQVPNEHAGLVIPSYRLRHIEFGPQHQGLNSDQDRRPPMSMPATGSRSSNHIMDPLAMPVANEYSLIGSFAKATTAPDSLDEHTASHKAGTYALKHLGHKTPGLMEHEAAIQTPDSNPFNDLLIDSGATELYPFGMPTMGGYDGSGENLNNRTPASGLPPTSFQIPRAEVTPAGFEPEELLPQFQGVPKRAIHAEPNAEPLEVETVLKPSCTSLPDIPQLSSALSSTGMEQSFPEPSFHVDSPAGEPVAAEQAATIPEADVSEDQIFKGAVVPDGIVNHGKSFIFLPLICEAELGNRRFNLICRVCENS